MTISVVFFHPKWLAKPPQYKFWMTFFTIKSDECNVDYFSLEIHHKFESHQREDSDTSSISHQNPHHVHIKFSNNQI